MKRESDGLERLLRLAARAPARPATPPAGALEERVLAAWRRSARESAGITDLRGVFRLGLAAAAALMLLVLAAGYRQVRVTPFAEVALSQAALQHRVLP